MDDQPQPQPLEHLRALRALLQAYQFRFQDEAQLHDAIAGVLER